MLPIGKVVCAVLDDNREYIFKFVDYINSRPNLLIEAVGFDNFEALQEYVFNNYVELLLVPEDYKDFESDNVSVKLILAREKTVTEGNLYIYKYQSMKSIVAELITYINDEKNSHIISTNGIFKKVIGVYSPVGRSFKTSFSLMLAKEFGKKYKTIYVSLEEYSGLEYFVGDNFNYTLSDALISYMDDKSKLFIKMERMLSYIHNIEILPSVKCIKDIYGTPIEIWRDFFQYLIDEGPYNVVIIDFGNIAFSREEIFKLCDVIYVPELKNSQAKEKIKEFNKHLESIKNGQLTERLSYIEIPYIKELANAEAFSQIIVNEGFERYVREVIEWKN